MFRLNNSVFFALLSLSGSFASTPNASNLTIYISLNNQLCMTRPTLFDLNFDEYNEGFFLFQVKNKRSNAHELEKIWTQQTGSARSYYCLCIGLLFYYSFSFLSCSLSLCTCYVLYSNNLCFNIYFLIIYVLMFHCF